MKQNALTWKSPLEPRREMLENAAFNFDKRADVSLNLLFPLSTRSPLSLSSVAKLRKSCQLVVSRAIV